jgi:hypothetical protein
MGRKLWAFALLFSTPLTHSYSASFLSKTILSGWRTIEDYQSLVSFLHSRFHLMVLSFLTPTDPELPLYSLMKHFIKHLAVIIIIFSFPL